MAYAMLSFLTKNKDCHCLISFDTDSNLNQKAFFPQSSVFYKVGVFKIYTNASLFRNVFIPNVWVAFIAGDKGSPDARKDIRNREQWCL